jgi:photosystem II stability/assembly factor-like uncharacterized protein
METTPGSKATQPVRTDLPGAQTIRPGWILLSILIVLVSGIVAILQAPNPQPTNPQKTFLEWLRYPVERNPGIRLPSAPAPLWSIGYADKSRNGLVVGQGGTILVSTNGGETWNAQDSHVSNSLYGIYCGAKCGDAWAVGANGVILNTADGGEHWNARQIQSNSDVTLRAVQFRKGGTAGWVAGSSGNIWGTLDGGQTWQKQENPDSRQTLNALYFDPQAQRGWAVGTGGLILNTTDGGRTWRVQRRDGANLNSVNFTPDGQHGWAVGANNTILSTTDGGDHWLTNKLPGSQDPLFIYSVEFNADGRRGWIARQDGAIFRTDDGGQTWDKENSGINTELLALHFDAEGLQGLAVGTGGTILSTSNGGLDWITRTSSKVSRLTSVHMDAAGEFAAAVGDAGTIIATLDGGAHWTSQASGVAQRLNSVDFLGDNRRGWAVGDVGTIIATDDGGKLWKPQESGTSNQLMAIQFNSDGQQGWAVGSDGLVLTTKNGGTKWHAQPLLGSPFLQGVYFEARGINGWALSRAGIFASKDGGQTWQRQNSAGSGYFSGLWFDRQGQRGWAVGNGGEIVSTGDGGESWIRQQSGTNADLFGIQFLDDDLRGWIAGGNGVILTTVDGGKNWSAADSKVGSLRTALAFATNGSVGWAVGYPPALVKTTDGGKTWQPVPWPLINQRYPAPWFWLMLIAVAVCFWRSVRADPGSAITGIEAIGTSDAPVGEFSLDRLQFGALARGISRFLRNTNTRPPLTLTISGDWGSGKSTLMELVCTDLRRFGIRPVWFNAWHHQQEEQLLAALLSAIRDDGLPPIGSADGLAFRFRLLVIRSKKHFIISLTIIAAVSMLTGYLLGHDSSEWNSLWNALNDIGARLSLTGGSIKTGITLGDVSWLSTQIVAATAALYSLYRGLIAFKIDPAVLLSSAADNFKLKDASAQTSFRTRFSSEFEEVTRALPYTMVLLVDDLDRCQPATVLTVMEAVNFLVSSGECFIIFGMATSRVEAALALEFENIADEVAALEERSPAETKENSKRDRRIGYVRDYLDKLINLEIIVPNRSDILPNLLDNSPTVKSSMILSAVRQCLEFWPSWLAGSVLILGVLLGFEYHFPPVNTQKALPVVQQAASAPDVKSAVPAAPMIPTPISQVSTHRYVPEMQENNKFVLDRLAAAITLAFIAAIAGGITLYGLRAASRRVYDSQAFRDALRIWLPVVQLRRGTPRGIKRFGNRLRYMAMLQQPAALDESGFDKLRKRLTFVARLFRRHVGGESQGGQGFLGVEENAISEPALVALASLYEIYGPDWRSHLQPTGDHGLEAAVEHATKRYTQTTQTSWPPNSSDLATFEQSLKGIKAH